MINKLNNLSEWLRKNHLESESSNVSDLLSKAGRSSIPKALSGIFTDKEMGLSEEQATDQVVSSPPRVPDSLKGLFTSEELGIAEDRIGTPSILTSDLKNKILYRGGSLEKGPKSDVTEGFVKEVQNLLKKHGYNLSSHGSDGIFGPETEKAIFEFQRNNKKGGARESGIIDGITLTLLLSAAPKPRDSEEVSSSSSTEPSALNQFDQEGASQAPQVPVTAAGEYLLPKVKFVSVPCKGCASFAAQEAKKYWGNGTISESHPDAEEPIQKYYKYTSDNNSWSHNRDRWGTGVRTDEKNKGKRQLNPVKERDENGVAKEWYHWSAVYVSYIMGHYDGEGAKWYVHEGHPGYIRKCKSKRAEIERNPEDHIGKMYYLWFTKEEMDKYGMKPEPGDVIGRNKHCDIYIGGGQLIGGNTCANNPSTGNKTTNCVGTSGPKPLRWLSGFGIIKRVRITGSGSNNMAMV